MYAVPINPAIHHSTNSVTTLQNINTPDIDLDRDVIPPEVESEIALGMETSTLGGKFQVNISTIMISALIFLAILSWFDFAQTAIFMYLSPDNTQELISPAVKLWYAIFTTIVVIILVVLIYYHFNDKIS